MIDSLIALDTQLFLFLNGLHVDWLDRIMIIISAIPTWIPLYLLLIYLVIRKYKKQSIWILLGVVIVFALSDRISAGFFKPYFHRLRPSHNPDLVDLIYLPNGKSGGRYGFISSHAANGFGLAMYISLAMKRYYKYIPIWMFSWAIVMSYSRIYLGVHYPGDVLVGALVGIFLGWIVWTLYQVLYKRLQKKR